MRNQVTIVFADVFVLTTYSAHTSERVKGAFGYRIWLCVDANTTIEKRNMFSKGCCLFQISFSKSD